MESKVVIERIARRYPSRWTQGYVRGKIGSDPIYATTLELVRHSALPILDIGCGMGFLAFYLREYGFKPPILGLDCDAAKIASAEEVSRRHYSNLEFRIQDAAVEQHFCGNVLIVDVLQYLEGEKQLALLDRVTAMIPPKGFCLIRATPYTPGWRFGLTRRMDRAMHAVGWMETRTKDYLPIPAISDLFVKAGFHCEARPLWGKTPFNSYLFVFTNLG